MTDHAIDYDTLIAIVLGEPVRLDQETVRRHLDACPDCQATIHLLSAAMATMQADAEPGPSARALERVRGRATRIDAISDEFGVFSLTIEPGNYDLLIQLGERVIVIPEVDVS